MLHANTLTKCLRISGDLSWHGCARTRTDRDQKWVGGVAKDTAGALLDQLQCLLDLHMANGAWVLLRVWDGELECEKNFQQVCDLASYSRGACLLSSLG